MEIINFKSLYKILNDKVDYIATTTTPWHAYGVLAAIKKVEDDNNCKLNGVILILRNFNEGYFLNKEYFKSFDCKIYYFDYKRSPLEHLLHVFYKIKYILTLNNSSKKSFYIFSQLIPNFNFLAYVSKFLSDRKLVSVICDEGLGSYFTENYKYKRRKVPYTFLPAKLYYAIENNVFFPILLKKLNDNNLINDCCLLKYENNKYIDNNIGLYFNNAISLIASNYKYEINQSNFNQKYVIINTQPFDVEDVADEQIVFDLYNRIIYLCNICRYKVFIKPHPREISLSKYNLLRAEVIETKLSQEEFNLLVENKPKAIISIISTTLLTSSVLCGIKSISIGKCLNNKKVSNNLIDGVEMAEKKFGGLILFPSNENDFLNIINCVI